VVVRFQEDELNTKPVDWDDIPESYKKRYVHLSVDLTCALTERLKLIEAEIRLARQEYRNEFGPFKRQELKPRRRFDFGSLV
jgi:hypothetical protein